MSFISVPAAAQQGGGPLGGSFRAIAIDPTDSNIVYTGSALGGVFKTTNGGTTWVSANSANFNRFVRALVIDPLHTTTVYAGTFQGVFKTSDGGVTWVATNVGLGNLNVQALAIDPSNTSILYAGTLGGVFKSTDGAASWAAASTGLTSAVQAIASVQAIAVDRSNPVTLFAGTSTGGVFKSADGGANWIATNVGLADPSVQSVAIDPSNSATVYAGSGSSGVFKSTDGGSSWSAANVGITLSTMNIRALVVDVSSPNVAYAATFGGVFKTTNAGLAWSAANSGMTLFNQSAAVPGAFALAVDPLNSSTVYVATQSGGAVFKSANAGSSWAAINAGLTATQIGAVAVDVANPGVVYASTNEQAVVKSITAGASWVPANAGFATVVTPSLAIDPTTPAVLYAGTSSLGVYRTTNGGVTWTRAGSGIALPVRALGINPTTPSTIYAATFGAGVYRSLDSGSTWVAVNTGLTDLNVQALVVQPSAPSTIYVGTDNGIFKSADGGNTWSLSSAGLTNPNVLALTIDPATPATVYAGTNGGVFKSLNAGASWTLSSNGITSPQIIHAIAIDASNPSTLYVGKASPGLVFKSTDGGLSWSNSSSGLPNFPTFVSALAIDPGAPITIYAGTDSSGVFESNDAGATWRPSASAQTVGLSSTVLTFSSRLIGSVSSAQTVTLTNTGSSALNIASVAVSGDFAQINTCGTSLPAGAGCTFAVTFSPTGMGSRTGALVVRDDAPYSPQVVSLSGTGIGIPALTLTTGTFTYDGNAHPAAVTATGVGGGPVAGSFLVTYSPGGAIAPVNAGSYGVNVAFTSSDSNYTNASVTGSITINAATPTVTVTGGIFTYDAAPHPATAVATGVGGAPVSGSFTFTYVPGDASSPLNVGTYSVSAAFTSSDPNYVNASSTTAPVLNVLHSFSGGTDGANPFSRVIQATDGNFYGTTQSGGSANLGVIFKMTLAGSVTLVHTFAGGSADGASPWDVSLLQAADGNFYGGTMGGGAFGDGTVFRMTPAGSVTILHSFAGGADGFSPEAPLIQGTDGNFYGTTTYGGSANSGTVFRMTSTGNVTILHSFTGADGAFPYGNALVQATDGNFYGTTAFGGNSNLGVIFRMTPAGTTTTLHVFAGGSSDGATSYSPLIQATDGALYGTTFSGGAFNNGTVFKITPAGSFSLVHSFTVADGGGPTGALIQAADGNFYGTTNSGGAFNVGVVFKMTTAGSVTVLHSFAGAPDGAYPFNTPVTQGTDGNLYGATFYGGAAGMGILYRLRPGPSAITINKRAPLVTVTGGIFDYNGIPHAAAATVTGVGGDAVPGTFSFIYTPGGSSAPVSPGTYAVTATFTSSDPNYGPGNGTTTIAVNPIIDRLAGRVTDAINGQAIGNVSVTVYTAAGSPVTTAVTDATGLYVSSALPNGIYLARTSNTANYSDQLYRSIACALGCDVTTGTPITAAAGLATPPVDFALFPKVGFGGTVTDLTGQPLAGIGVALYDSRGSPVQQTVTTQTGVYQFPDLLPQRYFVRTQNSAGYGDQLFQNISCMLGCDVTAGTPISVSTTTAVPSVANFLIAPNTPIGALVGVTPLDQAGASRVTVTFASVLTAGRTVVITSGTGSGSALPPGYQLGSPPFYFNVTTTAAYSPPVLVCVNYAGMTFSDPNHIRLLQDPGSGWTNVTSSLDQQAQIVCATVSSVAAFVVAENVSPPVAQPVIAVAPVNGVFGGKATLSATLSAGAFALSGKSLMFALNGAPIGSAITNAAGVATLANVALTAVNAGAYPGGVQVTFGGEASLLAAVGTANLVIAKATPVITWTRPSPIIVGTPLGALQLNAVAGVPGAFSYQPPAGTVLLAGNDQPLAAIFTPTDAVNYAGGVAAVAINVAPAVVATMTIDQQAIGTQQIVQASGLVPGTLCSVTVNGVPAGPSLLTNGATQWVLSSAQNVFPRVIGLSCGSTQYTGTQLTAAGTVGLSPSGTLTFQAPTPVETLQISGTGFPALCLFQIGSTTAGAASSFPGFGGAQTSAAGSFSFTITYPAGFSDGGTFVWSGTQPCSGAVLAGANPGGPFPRTIPMTDAGVGVGVLANPNPVDVGLQPVGVRRDVVIQISNAGTGGVLVLRTLTLSGPDAATTFRLVSTPCATGMLTAGASCSITIGFTPPSPGPRTAFLDIGVNQGVAPLHIPLAGSGISGAGRLVGRITDARTSLPISNVTVTAYNSSGVPSASAVTDVTGTYASPPLASGTYFARTTNTSDYSDQLYRNISCALGCNVTSGTAISVSASVATPVVDFQLSPRIGFGGTVTSTDSQPLTGVTVALYDTSGNALQQVVTDQAGAYRFPDLPLKIFVARTRNAAGYLDELYDNLACALGCNVTQGTPISMTVGVVVPPVNFALSPNTPIGASIVVTPPDQTGASRVTVTYASVLAAGRTIVTTSNTGPALPPAYQIGAPPFYFDVTTTAAYGPPVQVCVNYSGLTFGDPSHVRLLHSVGGAWANVTSSLDQQAHVVCGLTSTLSPFALVEQIADIPTVTVTGGTFTYDGSSHAASAVAVGVGGVQASDVFTVTYAPGGFSVPVNAGIYAVTATVTSGDPNDLGASGTGTIVINPATPTVTVTGGTFAYTGTPHSAAATAVGIGGASVSGSFAVTYTPGGSAAPVNVGGYSVSAAFTSNDSNYTSSTGSTSSITIGPATPTVVVSGTFAYDGNPHAAAATAFGVGGATVSGSFTFSYAPLALAPVDAGVHPVIATFTSSDPNYTSASGAGSVTINPAIPTLTVAGGTFVYDGVQHPATAIATGLGGVTIPGVFTFAYSPGGSSPPVNVGTYDVSASFASSDPNYAGGSQGGSASSVTVAQTFTEDFNRAAGAVGNGWSSWGGCAAIAGGQLRTCGEANVAGGIARSLPVTFPATFAFDFRTDAPDDGGWQIGFNAQSAANPSGSGSSQFVLGQYAGGRSVFYVYRTTSGTQFISVPLVPGQANYESLASAHIAGIVLADLSTSTTITYPDGHAVTIATPAPAGAILAAPGSLFVLGNSNATFGPDYFDNVVVHTLIGYDAGRGTLPQNQGFSYSGDNGNPSPFLSNGLLHATTTAGGQYWQQFNSAIDFSQYVVVEARLRVNSSNYVPNVGTGTREGYYLSIQSGSAGGPAYSIGLADGGFNINSITVPNQNLVPYPIADGTFHTYRFEIASNLGSLFIDGVLVANAIPPYASGQVGSYYVDFGGAAGASRSDTDLQDFCYGTVASACSYSSNPAQIAITPATPVVAAPAGTFPYDGSPHAPTAAATGVNGAAVQGSFAFIYTPGGAVAPVNVGTYGASATFISSDPNYTDATSGPGSMTITPALPTVTVGDTVTYDGNPRGATATAIGAGGVTVPGSFVFSYAPLASAPVNAGVYPVAVAFTSSDPNYTNASGAGSLTINPATPTLTVAGGTFTYDGAAHAATATATGLGGVTLPGAFSFTYAPGGSSPPVDAGTYVITAQFTSSDPNYASSSQTGALGCVISLSDIVSWWPGEQNATDTAGHSNGALTGVTFTTGMVDQAFKFDGSNSSMSVGRSASIVGVGGFSVEAWLKTAAPVGVILQQRDPTGIDGEYVLSVGGISVGGFASGPGRVCWSTYDNAHGFGINFCSNGSVDDGVFHHVAAVRAVDGRALIYIDGVVDASMQAPVTVLQPLGVFLGADMRDGARFLDGILDEPSVYNRALSPSEILAIFSAGGAGKCAAPTTITIAPATPVVTTAGGTFAFSGSARSATAIATGIGGAPVAGSFTFTYSPGGTSAPVSVGTYAVSTAFTSGDPNYTNGTGNAASIAITPATPAVAIAGTFIYDGNTHPAITTATGPGGAPVAGSFSVTYSPGGPTAPVNAGTYGVTATFTSADPNFTNASNTGSIVINRATPTITVTGGTFAYDGSPHAAVATATGIGGGAVSGSFTLTYSPGGSTPPVNAGKYSVTTVFASSDPNYSDASVNSANCVVVPPGVVSWWTGDGNASDIVGANNGALRNGATFAPGKLGQAFSLSGNAFVEIPDSASLTPPTSSLTVDAWVKPVSFGGVIISKYQQAAASWILLSKGSGELRFGVSQDNTGNKWRTIDTTSPVLTLGVWQHVLATFDVATQDMKIYVDGGEVPSTLFESATVTSIFDSASPVRIGAAIDGNGSFFGFWHGLIDEVHLFDRALSALEVASIYNAGSAAACSGSITIRGAPTVAVSGGPFTYDGAAHPATVTASGAGGVTAPGTLTVTYTPGGSSPPVNAGTYEVTATFTSSDPAFTDMAGVTGSVTVNPATPAVSVGGGPFGYDGNPHPATASAVGVGGATPSGSLSVSYAPGGSSVPVGAGTYSVTATFTSADPNYSNATTTASLTINRATPTVSVTGGAFGFNGLPHSATATAAGVSGEPVAGAFSFAFTPGGSSAPLTIGDYSVAATFASSDPNYANASGTAAISINPLSPLSAITLTTDHPVYRRGQPVQITGRVTSLDGTGISNIPVAVQVSVAGSSRTFSPYTDAQGGYHAAFQPAATDGGTFSVTAATTAGGVTQTASTSFRIVGLLVSPGSLSQDQVMGSELTVPLDLQNVGDAPLTNVSYAVTVTPAGPLTGSIAQSASSVAPGAHVTAPLAINAAAGDPPQGPVTVQVDISATDSVSGAIVQEGSSIIVTLRPAISTPVLTPASLSVGVNPGKSLTRRFRVSNTGYMAMANATVTLQDPTTFNWVNLGNAALGDVAPGDAREFQVLINPPADLPLGDYVVPFSVSGGTSPLQSVINISVTQSTLGAATFIVSDDIGAKVGGAAISLYSASKGKLYQAVSGDDGQVAITDVDAGDYSFVVTAPSHDPTSGTITVTANSTVQVPVLLSYDVVSLSFSVTPTTIVDQYTVTLNVTYRTSLPKPALQVVPYSLGFSFFPEDVADGKFACSLNITNSHPTAPVRNIVVDASQLDIARPNGQRIHVLFPGGGSVYSIDTLPGKGSTTVGCYATLDGGDVLTHDAGNVLVQANYDFSLDGQVLQGTTTTKVPVTYVRPADLSFQPIKFTYDMRTDPQHPVLKYEGGGYLYTVKNNRNLRIDLLKPSGAPFSGSNLIAFTATLAGTSPSEVIAANQGNVFWRTDFNSAKQTLDGAGDVTTFDISTLDPPSSNGSTLEQAINTQIATNAARILGLPSYLGFEGQWADDTAPSSFLVPVEITTITPTTITMQGPSRGEGGDICLNPEDLLCKGFPDKPPVPAREGTILLAIDQKVRLERQAFNAMLGIGTQATLVNAVATIQVRDLAGNDASSKFFVLVTSDASGATHGGTVSGGASVSWQLIPNADAGGTSPQGTQYAVQGTLNYVVSGVSKTVSTQAVTITVLPSPKLTVAYTVPFVVMAGKDAKIRVTVQNTGAGTAHNLSIQSAQPRIVASIPDDPGDPENPTPGPVVDFTLTGSSNAADATGFQSGNLVINFGDVAPGATVSGYWTLQVSRNGFFVDVSSTFKHEDYQGIQLDPLVLPPTIALVPAIGGSVATGSGQAIPGLTVRVSQQGTEFGSDTTDSSGVYYISDLVPGSYLEEVVDLSGAVLTNKTITVLGNQGTNFINFVLQTYDPTLALVVVNSDPPGAPFSADGQTYSTPHTFIWDVGSTHVLGSAPNSNAGGGSTPPSVFVGWSDGETSDARSVTVGPLGIALQPVFKPADVVNQYTRTLITSDPSDVAIDHKWPSTNNKGDIIWSQRDPAGYWQVWMQGPSTGVVSCLATNTSTCKVTDDPHNHERPTISDDGTIAWFQDGTGQGLGYAIMRRSSAPGHSISQIEYSSRNNFCPTPPTYFGLGGIVIGIGGSGGTCSYKEHAAGKTFGMDRNGRTISYFTFYDSGQAVDRPFNLDSSVKLPENSTPAASFVGYGSPDINSTGDLVYANDFVAGVTSQTRYVWLATTTEPFSQNVIEEGDDPHISEGPDPDIVYVQGGVNIKHWAGGDADWVALGLWGDISRTAAGTTIVFECMKNGYSQICTAVPNLSITSPVDASTPRSRYLVLSGKGRPGASLDLIDNETTVLSNFVAIEPDGQWEALIEPVPGPHLFSVQYSSSSIRSNAVNVRMGSNVLPTTLSDRSPFFALRKADIIVSYAPDSPQVALYGANWTHVALYLGGDSDGTPIVAEAVTNDESSGLGEVRALPLDMTTVYGTYPVRVAVFRAAPEMGVSRSQRSAIADWARTTAGRGLPYWNVSTDFIAPLQFSWLDWAKAQVGLHSAFDQDMATLDANMKSTDKFICSTLVWRAYLEGANVDLSQPNNLSAASGSFLSLFFAPPFDAAFVSDLAAHVVVPETFVRSPHLRQVAGTSASVGPVVPSITWTAPMDIVYGTALSGVQLNASSTVAGSFTYSPSLGTVLDAGSRTLSATFLPTDTASYAPATATVQINVTKAQPTITWTDPADIIYGTLLDNAQLNATASTTGSFVYAPPPGTLLASGTHTLTTTFTPDDATNYTIATATVDIDVAKATPNIVWATPPPIVFGAALLTQLNATADVPGAFSYSPHAGTILNAGNAQPLSVTFTPDDTTNYDDAMATAFIDVLQRQPALSWTRPADIVYGTALGGAQLNATASVQGSFAYTPAAGTVLTAGINQTLSVTFTPADATDYSAVTTTVPINVLRATPAITWPTPADIVSGTALSATQLNATANVPGTFVYSPSAGTVLPVGANQTLSVTFTPSDATDYTTAVAAVRVNVSSAALNVSVVSPNGGERVFVGVAAPIQWSVPGTSSAPTSFDVALSTNGGTTFTNIAGCVGLSGSDRTCLWTPTNASANALVRVTAHGASAATAADVSDATFRIAAGPPAITVTAPNTGVTWAVGTAHANTWNHNLGINTSVRVELSRDDGASWAAIAASTPNATATTGIFNWTVSGPPTTTARIRVTWLGGPATDVSNVAFTIAAPAVTLTAPNTAVSWRAGDTHNVSFSHNLGVGQVVNIDLSRDGGATWTLLTAFTTTSATSGTYPWLVTAPSTMQARVRVTWAGDASVTDASNVNFTILDRVNVKAPNTAVNWRITSTQTITWNHNLGVGGAVNIDVSRDGGTSWNPIASGVPSSGATTGSYAWTVTGPPTTQASIRVSWSANPSSSDTSDVNFSLVNPTVTVTAPNTAVSWRAGDTHNITFTHNMGVGQVVNIAVSRDSGTTWSPVTAFTTTSATSGTYPWVVSGPPTTYARIRLSWTADASVSDTSNVDFTITPRVIVTAPNTAVTWGAGSTRQVTWTHNLGTGETVNIDFSQDGGVTWVPLAAGVANATATTGNWTGPLPATPTSQALIRVSPSSDPADGDVSSVPFTLAAPVITVTAPNSNVTWVVGSTHAITWTHNLGNLETVNLEISRDGGTSWTSIGPGVANSGNTSGTFSWQVTGPATTAARVRVTWTQNGTVQDSSNVSFTIR